MSKNKSAEATIVDAKDLVLGRMASVVAKRLLNGEKIVIVNADQAVISGKRLVIFKKAEDFLQVGHFRKGPLHARRPDNIVRKVVRGMVPKRKAHGLESMKRLRVYIGVPNEFEDKQRETLSEMSVNKLKSPYIRVSELAQAVGWKE